MYRLVLLLSITAVAFAEVAGPGAPAAPAAPAGAPAGAQAQPSMLPSLLLMVGIFAFMYFVLIRPQKKEEARRKEMIAGLKRGDAVVTGGGLHGTIESVGEHTVDLRIGSGDKTLVVQVTKAAVAAVPTAETAKA